MNGEGGIRTDGAREDTRLSRSKVKLVADRALSAQSMVWFQRLSWSEERRANASVDAALQRQLQGVGVDRCRWTNIGQIH